MPRLPDTTSSASSAALSTCPLARRNRVRSRSTKTAATAPEAIGTGRPRRRQKPWWGGGQKPAKNTPGRGEGIAGGEAIPSHGPVKERRGGSGIPEV